MKRSLGVGEWIRRGLGVAVLAGVVAIAFGLDTGLLTRVSLASTGGLEQALIAARSGNREVSAAQAEAAQWREREADARAEVSRLGCCSRQLHSHGL